MYAKRDYLVKQVFPQLCEWYEKRKLRLVDIDLRSRFSGNSSLSSHKDRCHV
jgi:hypothetical protein